MKKKNIWKHAIVIGGVLYVISLIYSAELIVAEVRLAKEKEYICERVLANKSNAWFVYRWECKYGDRTHVFYGDSNGFTSVVVDSVLLRNATN